MAILNKKNKKDVEKYEKFIKNSDSSLMQSMNWGKVKNNWKTEYIYVEEKGKIVAAMSVLLNKIGKTNIYMAYSPRGPVCDLNNVELVEKLLKEVDKLKKKYNIFLFKFDPNVKANKELEEKYKKLGLKILNTNVSSDDLIQPLHDMVLYLEEYDEDSLFKTFSEKTRYNIRLAKRKGVEVSYSRDEEDLKQFYEIYKVTTIRDKIDARPYEYFKRMLDAYGEDELRIYVAKHDGDFLSAALAYNYGGEVFYLYGASSNEKRNLMPNYLMQWHMIQWALETKAKKYNFGGVIHMDPLNGLYKFKIGFCKKDGVTEYIGEMDRVYNVFMYCGYRYLLPTLKKIKRVIRNEKLKNKKKK